MKNTRMLLALLALVLVVACLAGCGKKDSPEGKWTAESVTAKGMTLTLDGSDQGSIDLEIKSGGKCTMTMNFMGENNSGEGTWEYKNGKGTLTIDNESVEFTIKDGKLTMSQDGSTFVFKKK